MCLGRSISLRNMTVNGPRRRYQKKPVAVVKVKIANRLQEACSIRPKAVLYRVQKRFPVLFPVLSL